jgi:hypothetical protein
MEWASLSIWRDSKWKCDVGPEAEADAGGERDEARKEWPYSSSSELLRW